MEKVKSTALFSFRLPEELLERLKRVSEAHDRPVGFVIKKLLEHSIESAEAKVGIK